METPLTNIPVPRSLEDVWLLKSFKRLDRPHKYVRHWFENGRWQYEYPDDSADGISYAESEYGNALKGKYGGEIWGDFNGRPDEAFQTLFRKQSGQCLNVFEIELPVFDYIDGKWKLLNDEKTGEPFRARTSIDLVWGKAKKNVGLSHIIDDHYVKHDDFHSLEDLQSKLVAGLSGLDYFDETNEEARLNKGKRGDVGFAVTNKSKEKFVFALEKDYDRDGNLLIRHLILTSYDTNTEEKAKENDDEEQTIRQEIVDKKKSPD